jgi:PPOX class probable F420-dependent enzyme
MRDESVERPRDPRGPAAGSLEALKETKTIQLTTFRRDGTPVATAVSVAFDGERAFFRTWHSAWKAKRLAHNPSVEVAPSNLFGDPTGPAQPARARLLTGAEARTAARALSRRHRALQAVLVPITHRLMRYRTLHYELLRRPDL